ncbi:hypothetical protein [Streptomyces sp. CBMA29]|uniref:hypothetical protein n=1 Tax=Streptomyces sp. CBMA29 TaxID=1896314 RepID=UPI0016619016|nr:hypothetical protein [Streptomyces sp. CBMA29]MBD0737151.1 hypothetical protein [Streptomyces sp. CBMA29]
MTDERFSEDDLRALLERAVPQLPAPVQRLERVKERALRRRRRRAAGMSATVVVAVAAAGLVLPGLGGTSSAPLPPAVTSLAPPASGSAPTEPAPADPTPTRDAAEPPSAASAAVTYHFPELAGLDLRLPPGWTTLVAPKTGDVFASSQALGLPTDGCVKPLDGFCTPLVRTLTRGGVLMMLTLRHSKVTVDKLNAASRPVTSSVVLSACRAVGGTAQTNALLTDASGSDVLIDVSVCLADATDAQRSRINDALKNAVFS